MTVVNGNQLLRANPIKDMAWTKERDHGVSWGLAEVGYDIRIKQTIQFSPAMYHRSGTLIRGPAHFVDESRANAGNFCLASTIEEFQMPSNLVAIVHDKSTWARKGLSVFNTVIEPGWKGFLTLELVYHGQDEIIIPAGSGIAQVIFHEVTEPAQYEGKYQNQADMPVASVFDK